jgi:hypothetical protein
MPSEHGFPAYSAILGPLWRNVHEQPIVAATTVKIDLMGSDAAGDDL